jgi:pSer/pThr/pTyr-binding forkhead associated (FHA) protein
LPHLIVEVPGKDPQRVQLDDTVEVGRLPPAALVVADPKVSRRHCKVSKSKTGWTVTDLGSANGTRVAGRVVKAHVLRDGDRVEIGRSALVFRGDAQPARVAPVRRSARERLAAPRKRR